MTTWVEVRRHSLRDRPEPHLSAAGRALAEEVGRTRGPFRLSVSSPVARAVETAAAMGWPSSEQRPLWADSGIVAIPWPGTFGAIALQAGVDSALQELARSLADDLAGLRDRVGDGERVLLVTHGGFPELVAAGLGVTNTAALGGPCRCLEGIEVEFGSPRTTVRCRALRLPDDRTRL